MLQKVDIYITGQILRALGFALLALVGMFWIGRAIPLIDQIILRSESLGMFFQLSSYLFPSILKIILPIASLIAVIFAFNRMANDGELMAIHNSGRNPIRLLLPTLMLGFMLTVFSIFNVFWFVPSSLFGLRGELQHIERNFTKNVISAEKFLSPDKNLYIYVENSLISGEMLDIFIDDRRIPGIARNYFAARALLVRQGDISKLALINGEYHERNLDNNQISIGKFDRLELSLNLGDGKSDELSYRAEETPTQQLLANHNLEVADEKLQGELADRLAFSALALIMPIIGALGFVRAPFSRKGYSGVVLRSVIFGLVMEAAVSSIRGVVINSPSMVFIFIFPILILLFAVTMTWRNVKRL